MARSRRGKPEALAPESEPVLPAKSREVVMCNTNVDPTATAMTLTVGTAAVTAALQMLLDQAAVRGEAMRAAQYSANLAQTAELATLGAMLAQMFVDSQPRTVDVKTVSNMPAPPQLAVS